MKKFNLITEGWIPCLLRDNTVAELGLLDTLARAHEIKEITDDSPLVVVSLHRLLLAILHRNFGPKTFEDWKNLWRGGAWNAEKLREYFEKFEDRFDLFDAKRPFYQYPEVAKRGGAAADKAPLELLMQEKAAGNNATLFDHSFASKPRAYSPAAAARALIARQAFSIGGGVGYPFNLSHGTLVRGLSVLATGQNLFETLALNLVVYYRNNPIPAQDDDGETLDKPFWERDHLVQAAEADSAGTVPLGYLDYLTWQSRRVKLFYNDSLQGVDSCQLQQNFKLSEAGTIFDPFKVFVRGNEGFYALDLNSNKQLWRNSHTLFQQAGSIEGRSNLFTHLAKVGESISTGEIRGQKRYSFSIFGIVNDKANVLLWSQERLPLPMSYLSDEALLTQLETAIRFAEDTAKYLRDALKKLADNLESDISSFQGMTVYWSRLETQFHNLLIGLPEKNDSAIRDWFRTVDATARRAFDQTANSLSGSATEQKAIVEAQNLFFGLRRKLLNGRDDYRNYLNEHKTAGGEKV
jgi:CRISPR system Cascade subunit CasA